ncbi:MAG: galactose-1-phosphate uridylyltransferase [Candidatus Kerfeldbacteria bacterium]|nr:galactose-1-phosphate uridylyltransferase [Candidatus Kerfeldbacteria bacterium]
MTSEIRKDYIQDKYVIIAPRRKGRPDDFQKEIVEPNTDKVCVFCRGNVDGRRILTTDGPRDKWNIAVLKNIFPAVSTDNPNAYGRQEVVVETAAATKQLEELPIAHIVKLLEVYAKRTKAISKDPKIEYILIFKNNGGRAGASLRHAHSQIFATEFLPPHLKDKSQKVQEYKLQHGTCVYCDVIAKERKGPRLVWENKHVIAFTPYASMHNYEIWIMPKRHIDNVTELQTKERLEFAKILRRVLRSIGELNLPYNFYFHQVKNDEDQHLYMKITPRGSVWAGVEIGSGLIINPVSPEDAAEFYRQEFAKVSQG